MMAYGSYPGGPRGPDRPPYQPTVYTAQPDKSYVGPAVITWALYYLGAWIVGLIVNIVYLSEAGRYAQATGRPASGVGCLWALLIVHLLLPLVVVAVLLVLGVLGAIAIPFIQTQ